MADYKAPIKSSLAELSASLTSSLRKEAINAGWPKKYADALNVVILNGDVTIKYSGEFTEAIEDLEYGTKKQPPIPVLRKFIDKYSVDIANDIMDSSLSALFNEGSLP